MTEVEKREMYDAGRSDVLAGAPVHDFEEAVHSDGRVHELTADCWCGPSVELVPARRVIHGAEVRA